MYEIFKRDNPITLYTDNKARKKTLENGEINNKT